MGNKEGDAFKPKDPALEPVTNVFLDIAQSIAKVVKKLFPQTEHKISVYTITTIIDVPVIKNVGYSTAYLRFFFYFVSCFISKKKIN